MSVIPLLSQRETWEKFHEYKTSLISSSEFSKKLRAFIDEEDYIEVCGRIAVGGTLSLPRKSVISKQSSRKKRTVYTYPEEENMVLKLITYLLLRKYDGAFTENLYSFRPGVTAKDAVRRLVSIYNRGDWYVYKADVSNYFNSIPVAKLLPMLEEVLRDDPEILRFLSGLLTEERVMDGDRIIAEEKGIMAGTPIASFYANLYLKDMDKWFAERDIPYARYSDDIIFFAETEEKREELAEFIKSFLGERGLAINPDKEERSCPGEAFTFLGFRVSRGKVDIAPASVVKLKKKMRRKVRALARWSKRNGIDRDKAARAFARVFKGKLLDVSEERDLSWSRWFFPVINTDESLKVIDAYAQDCMRYLASGVRTKARFNVRYEDLKELGYVSLVHEYYSFKREENEEKAD
jgi:hypothetical protein